MSYIIIFYVLFVIKFDLVSLFNDISTLSGLFNVEISNIHSK